MTTDRLVWERVDRNIQDRIDEWHLGAGDDQEVYEYLGWTQEEYMAWVEDPKKIPDRELEK